MTCNKMDKSSVILQYTHSPYFCCGFYHEIAYSLIFSAVIGKQLSAYVSYIGSVTSFLCFFFPPPNFSSRCFLNSSRNFYYMSDRLQIMLHNALNNAHIIHFFLPSGKSMRACFVHGCHFLLCLFPNHIL